MRSVRSLAAVGRSSFHMLGFRQTAVFRATATPHILSTNPRSSNSLRTFQAAASTVLKPAVCWNFHKAQACGVPNSCIVVRSVDIFILVSLLCISFLVCRLCFVLFVVFLLLFLLLMLFLLLFVFVFFLFFFLTGAFSAMPCSTLSRQSSCNRL